MATFSELLSKTNLPEAALAPLNKDVADYTAMVNQSNALVASVNAAKAQDPNNVDYLDKLWRAKETDEAIAEKVTEFDAIAEQYEKLLKELRDHAKANYIPEQLSEDAAKNARKQVNEMQPTISESRKAIASKLELVESVLRATGVEIPEGGLVTLLPQADSLKNARGRKAATTDGNIGAYMTRCHDILLDGKSTQVNGKGKFTYAADALSQKWGGGENKVTGEEIEEAFYASLGRVFRDKSEELPLEHTFTFEKSIRVQNPNDDSKTEVPQKVQITFQSEKFGKQQDEPKSETTEPAKVEQAAKPEAAKSEPVKNEAPAKKAAAPAKK